MKKVNRFVKTRSVEEQSQALKKYLKKSSSKHFRPGDLVMKNIDTDGKQLEKGYSLKVSFRTNFSINWIIFPLSSLTLILIYIYIYVWSISLNVCCYINEKLMRIFNYTYNLNLCNSKDFSYSEKRLFAIT